MPAEPAREIASPNPATVRRDAFFTGLAAFVLYVATNDPHVAAHDAGQFHTLARTGGIAHAGYPLLTLVLQVFGNLPLGSLPFRANLLSNLSGAVAVGLAAWLAITWTRSRVAGVIGAAGLALTLTMWQEASFAGVHAFTLAMDAAVFLLARRFSDAPSARLAFAIGGLYGFCLVSHLTSLSLGPLLVLTLLLAWRTGALRPAHVGAALLGLVLGLSPLGYLVAMDRADQPMNYIADTIDADLAPGVTLAPATIADRTQRVAWLLSARQYLGQSNFDMLGSLARRFAYLVFGLGANEYPFGTLALVLLGLVAWVRRFDRDVLRLLVWLFGAALFVGVGASFTMARIFFLPGLWVLAVALAAGVAWIARGRPAVAVLAAALVVSAPFVRLSMAEPPARIARVNAVAFMWPMWPERWSPLRRDASWDEYGRGVMGALEPDAVVLACWEEATTLRYFRFAEPLRRDVDVEYACHYSWPRVERRVAELAGGARPLYLTYALEPGRLPGWSAERVWSNARGGVWRLRRVAPDLP